MVEGTSFGLALLWYHIENHLTLIIHNFDNGIYNATN